MAQERLEAERKAAVRNAEVLAAKRAQHAPASRIALPVVCSQCETPSEGFSFCPTCGADLPGVAVTPTPAQNQTVSQGLGVRDTRAAMRRVAQAYENVAVHQKESATETQSVRSGISPPVSAALSFFFPGVGQILNGQVAKGLAILVAYLLSRWLPSPFQLGLFIAQVLIAVDAYRIAERRRRGEPVKEFDWDIA